MNPWEVQSLQDFTFICCPECVYRSQDAESFECHALENHPKSLSFFKIVDVKLIDFENNGSQEDLVENFDNESQDLLQTIIEEKVEVKPDEDQELKSTFQCLC